MDKRNSSLLHLLFFIIVAVELTGEILGDIRIEYPVKPLIMIWMAIYFLRYSNKKDFTVPVIVAFFFSWAGDIFLMLSESKEIFFFAGAGAFLLAQVSYIYTFAKFSENGGRGYLARKPVIGLLFLGYVAGIFSLLYPGLEGPMKPIVLIYALSLLGMSMMALNRQGRVNRNSYLLVFIGSLFFVISDSMLALNKFYQEFPLAGLLTMATYIIAQYMIMRGLLLEQPVRT